jgi:nucleotide-binding universal stress UspA family protein
MSNQQHLLLATDLSDTAKAAAVWAYTYAKATGAKVTLAHIVEISIPNWFKDAYSVTEDAARLAKHQDKIRAWYSDATGGAAADEVVVRVGQPYEQLREMVPELDIHMIIVSQSGKGAVEKILSGSLARSLVSVPPCAVVVVDPGHNTAFSHMEVTVATDLTDKAERALLFGAYITRLFHGQLDVVHASQLITAADLEADELPAHLQPEAIEAAARQQMDAVITRHADTLQKIEYASHVVLEHPVRAVQSFVGSKPQDLVILGTGDHTNIISNNFGRVSVKLMESLPCSVMVVPSTAQLTGKVD